MTLKEVMTQLEAFGNEGTKKILRNHGAEEPFFGVKVGDLKKITKKIKKDHHLSLELYATRNTDAMYLAGLIADEDQITKKDLKKWVKEAYWYYISEFTVPWVAAETKFGFDLGLEWIKSKKENIAAAGWSTLSSLANLRPDEELDIDKYSELLDHIGEHIHEAPNRVRYVMNGFVIAVGGAIKKLSPKAKKIAKKIGKVEVNVGDTACKVPLATDYIQKVIDRGALGKKRKSARC